MYIINGLLYQSITFTLSLQTLIQDYPEQKWVNGLHLHLPRLHMFEKYT